MSGFSVYKDASGESVFAVRNDSGPTGKFVVYLENGQHIFCYEYDDEDSAREFVATFQDGQPTEPGTWMLTPKF